LCMTARTADGRRFTSAWVAAGTARVAAAMAVMMAARTGGYWVMLLVMRTERLTV
jgi:hypothetical protein